MDLIQEKFSSVFSNYEVTTQPRPDSSISYAQLHTAEQLTWVISAIRRDLAGQPSELPSIALLQSVHCPAAKPEPFRPAVLSLSHALGSSLSS